MGVGRLKAVFVMLIYFFFCARWVRSPVINKRNAVKTAISA